MREHGARARLGAGRRLHAARRGRSRGAVSPPPRPGRIPEVAGGLPGLPRSCPGRDAPGRSVGRGQRGVSSEGRGPCSDPPVCERLGELVLTLGGQPTPALFDQGDGQFPVTFAAASPDAHGRAIDVHGTATALRYWIDTAIRVRRIERISRGRRVLTTFDEIVRATPGRVLPARTTISTWDLASGALLSSDVFDDRHHRLEHTWLPLSRCIAVSSADVTQSVTLILEDHQLF